MRPRVSPIRSWMFDEHGRMLAALEYVGSGYQVTQAARLGGQRRVVRDPEDAEMLAAAMGRGRRSDGVGP